jgi:hypothetical protein
VTNAEVMDKLYDAIRAIEESRRNIICEPRMVKKIERALDKMGIGGMFEVTPSPYCPVGQILIVKSSVFE